MVAGNSINETTTGICGFTGTAFTGTAVTNHSLILGAATSSTLTNLGVATNGQLPIGSTGADPTLAVPTSTGGTFTTGAGSLLYTPSNFTVGYSNLGINYNSGTGSFSVQGSTASLGASNPGYVTLPSKTTPGTLVTIALTANQNFTDASGTSEIVSNLFGFTSGVAIAVDVPFFIYAVLNSAENAVQFMCGRTPHKTVAPAAGNIGFPGTPGTNAQTSLFSFDTITAANYATQPCLCIGSFRMQMSSGNDWTVQTLASTDGVGRFNDNTFFTIPLGQFGANSSTLTVPNGGTAATFASTLGRYQIKHNGICHLDISLATDAGTDGSGAVDARIITPFNPANNTFAPCTTIVAAATVTFACANITGGTNYLTWQLIGAVNITWAAYSNGNRSFNIGTLYNVAV